MRPYNIHLLLKALAEKNEGNGLTFYFPGQVDAIGKKMSYYELLQQAKKNAFFIHQLGLHPGTIILLHFDNHLDNIEWFWSVVCAGFVPAISTPFTNNEEQRKKHIIHLHSILNNPICFTRKKLLPQFSSQDLIKLHTIDDISPPTEDQLEVDHGSSKAATDIAVLMLTSGSTGNAKAVCLTNEQVLASVESKSKRHGTRKCFLNWIGFDHVACLTEIHLHAMWVGAEQIMVQAEELVPNPLLFLELVAKHRVVHSFAPNFFLAGLRRALETSGAERFKNGLDISCLQCIVTGGEANVVETCIATSKLLETYGAPSDLLSPAFGMTETCGGAIYSKDCPRRDIECNNEFATVGFCVEAMEMRIVDDNGKDTGLNTLGNLEVRGKVVFLQYYNNPKATIESFNDGWFITGDRGFLDSLGQLQLTGRSKDIVIINGVNYVPLEIETALELEEIQGIKPSYTIVFPYRPKGSETESICVAYHPVYPSTDVETMNHVYNSISKSVIQQTGVKPTIIPLNGIILQKSTLGKLPRAKVRAAYEKGELEVYQKAHDNALAIHRRSMYEGPTNSTEQLLLETLKTIFDIPEFELGIKTNIFLLGINSISLIKLKNKLQVEFGIEIPIITIITNPSVQSLAIALEELQQPRVYNPMIILQNQGSKAPLWLIHPGVGEILIFLQLASYITDRPVYAMRARGFEKGEPYFQSISEVVATYVKKIKEQQPNGPYAIAGYSYGSMIAFEVTKVLQEKAEVKFLGVLNLPPHIKFRMRQLDWTNCLLHLSYFLDFFSEEYAQSQHPVLKELPKEEVLEHIMRVSSPERMAELGLDKQKLANWADLAYSLQSSAVDYEPTGMVGSIDVFCAIPLPAVAKDMEDWKTNHLSKWEDFSKSKPCLHEVDGAHYTMIGSDHVFSFQKKLKMALQNRGI